MSAKSKRAHWKLFRLLAPQAVYGGVDGTVSTFAVVAAAHGGGLPQASIFVLGVASLVADGFSMAVGAYLSAEAGRRKNPFRNGMVTFLSFNILGSLLLLPYLYGVLVETQRDVVFIASSSLAVISFTLVGIMKAKAENLSVARGAVEVVALGVIAAGIAYGLGVYLEHLIA